MTAVNNILLVHGGFVDGSGWRSVYDELTADGFHVVVVQNPTISLDGDAQLVRDELDALDGKAIIVGHSYGGAVITAAGTHEKVAGLVYITAFALDQGESVGALANTPVPGYDAPPIGPPRNGFLFLDGEKAGPAFAGDLSPADQAFLAHSQVPWGLEAVEAQITDPAWKYKPTWYMVSTDDKMIPPPAQRMMAERARATTIELAGSHAIYVSKGPEVASFIAQAARAVSS